MDAPFRLAGEIAGVTAAVLWAFSSFVWHVTGRRIGSVAVTTIRIAAATAVLALVHLALYGTAWPADMSIRAQVLLALSGILGAGLGDMLLFRSFQLIGPRLGLLMLALAPILAAVIAWYAPPHEQLGGRAVLGILMTIGGVAWAVSERHPHPTVTRDRRLFRQGVWLALGGSLSVGVSFAITKLGLRAAGAGQSFPGTLIRVAAATVFCLAALPVTGRIRTTVRALRDRRAMMILAGGVVVGPVLGIWLSLVAFDYAATGVASTLISLAPIAMIPISWAAYGERPTLRAVAGTFLAVAGTAILFLRAAG